MFKQLVVFTNFILCALLLSGCEEQKSKLNSSLDTIYKELAPLEELVEPKEFNLDYSFEFDACSLRINGADFDLDSTLDKWVALLGEYNKTKWGRYYWDDLGIIVSPLDLDDPAAGGGVKFQFSQDATDNHILKKMSFVNRTASDFVGAISMNGILLDRNMDYKVFNRQLRENGDGAFKASYSGDFHKYYKCEDGGRTYSFSFNGSIEPYPSVITYFSVH
jgi:hypothetical protein